MQFPIKTYTNTNPVDNRLIQKKERKKKYIYFQKSWITQ